MLGHLLFTLPPAQVRALSQEARKAGSHPALATDVWMYCLQPEEAPSLLPIGNGLELG